MSPPQSPPLENLLAQVGWIRELSRKLVRDPDLADEVVQQTLVRASREGPREPASLRAWLGALVRNFARAGLRSELRRRHHEQIAARPEGLPSAHEVVERAALQRELVECVMELEEPYRTTILLRFYEAQSAHAIAKQLGVPAATVRTRLARGLTVLRTRLDRRHGGDRAAWAVLAIPIKPVSFLPLAPFVAMNFKATLAVCALCAVGVVWFLAIAQQPSPPNPRALAAEPQGLPAQLERPTEAVVDASKTRTQAEAATQPSTAVAPAASEAHARKVLGRVIDVDSRAVGGLSILLVPTNGEASTEVATSSADGSFELDRPVRAARLEVDDERWCMVFAGLVGSQADQRACTIIVAPNAPLSGSVADDAGVPLGGVELSVDPDFSLRTRFADILDASENVRSQASTDATGRFEFKRLPRCEGLRLQANLANHVPYAAPLVDTDRPFKAITLKRTSSAESVLRGRVVDAGDLPVAQAVVALGMDTTMSDEHGEFAISKQLSAYSWAANDSLELRALAPGRLPTSFAPPIVDGAPKWPEFITLRLGGKPLSLRGRVELADGKPLAKARVWLTDTTTLGDGPGGMLQVEGWLAGDTQNAWHFATTDEDGKFELDGLLEREYTLCTVDAATLERATLEHVAAGRVDVLVRFSKSNAIARLEGVAIDGQGVPIADVRVVPTASGFMARYGGRNLFSTSMSLDGVLTDAEGRFVLENVPREEISLVFSGDAVLTKYLPLDAKVLGESATPNLRVVLDRRMHLQVELADPTSADHFALLDADGAEISMSLHMGSTTVFMNRPPIINGRSHVASANERARSVVTYKDNKEVGRVSVRLSAVETTVVKL